VCRSCGRAYPSKSGVLDFIPQPPPDEEVLARWQLWERVEANGLVAYRNDPGANLSVGPRDDCRAFAAFAELEGLVLDVGCGPQRLPSYAADFQGSLVGIDPLLGELPRTFAFVRGIGEYLPFRPSVFDRVLFATSLDHALLPTLALAEARRVVKPSGTVIVWIEDKSGRQPKPPKQTQSWYEELATPEGAVDRFHAVQLSRRLLRQLVEGAGLRVVDARADGQGNLFTRTTA
jgi:SAM-dependent methyltransferase